jgi:hypothetical protein
MDMETVTIGAIALARELPYDAALVREFVVLLGIDGAKRYLQAMSGVGVLVDPSSLKQIIQEYEATAEKPMMDVGGKATESNIGPIIQTFPERLCCHDH